MGFRIPFFDEGRWELRDIWSFVTPDPAPDKECHAKAREELGTPWEQLNSEAEAIGAEVIDLRTKKKRTRGRRRGTRSWEVIRGVCVHQMAARIADPYRMDGIPAHGGIFDDAIVIVTGMRLGNDSATAASKAGAGSNIVTYISGSQEALDAAATHSDKGSGLGYRATHICTWIAGDITDADIEETVLTDETPITDVAGASTNVVARFIFASTIDKQAGDSLEVTWHLDALGA